MTTKSKVTHKDLKAHTRARPQQFFYVIPDSAFCPFCGSDKVKRHCKKTHKAKHANLSRPTVVVENFHSMFCHECKRHFSPVSDNIPKCGRYTYHTRRMAVHLVLMKAMTLMKANSVMRTKYHVHVPMTTMHEWIIESLTEA